MSCLGCLGDRQKGAGLVLSEHDRDEGNGVRHR